MSADNNTETAPKRVGRPFPKGTSGNPGGRAGSGLMRRKLLKSFKENEPAAMAALARRWGNPRYVQDLFELLAKLEGELTKEASDSVRGVQIILLNNQGASPLDPEVFREAARRKALESGEANR